MGRLNLSHLGIAAVLSIAAVAIPLAHADDVDQVRQLRHSESILPLSQILKKIESKFPGTLLDVELEHDEGAAIYEIEILGHDNQVQKIKVDAQTGNLIKDLKEDGEDGEED